MIELRCAYRPGAFLVRHPSDAIEMPRLSQTQSTYNRFHALPVYENHLYQRRHACEDLLPPSDTALSSSPEAASWARSCMARARAHEKDRQRDQLQPWRRMAPY